MVCEGEINQGGEAMKNKHFFKFLGLLLTVSMLVFAAPAQAEMYVEAYLGGVQGANAGMDVSNSIQRPPNEFVQHVAGQLDPAVIGGLKIGTWFVKEGFLGYNYPDWMKYFGFYLDFSYHRLNFTRQTGSTTYNVRPERSNTMHNVFWSEGNAATLAFMFAGRYGFLPDSEVPFGRLQPYLAVGPAILFASQTPAFNLYDIRNTTPLIDVIKPASQSGAFICLAVEAGIRWMALKNVSIDLSFKYRYAAPSFTYNYYDMGYGDAAYAGGFRSVTLDPTMHLFSGQLGAAYHF